MVALICPHVLAAERIHADDTTVPVLAKNRTSIGRLWTYVRDDRPFGGPAPPAALFHYSAERGGVHPARHLAGYSGILQADAYAGFNDLYHPGRQPGPITETGCWAHRRRKLFSLAEVGKAPVAAEAVPTNGPTLYRKLGTHLFPRTRLLFSRTTDFPSAARGCNRAGK